MRIISIFLAVVLWALPVEARPQLEGKTVTIRTMCLELSDLRLIVEEYKSSTQDGNLAFKDMVDGGKCGVVPGGVPVEMIGVIEPAGLSEPAHIWHGRVHGRDVYMLISDHFKEPGKGV